MEFEIDGITEKIFFQIDLKKFSIIKALSIINALSIAKVISTI